jgi:hypothetical protein
MTDIASIQAPDEWRNRISNEVAFVDPREIAENPQNFRLHPSSQRAAFQGSVESLGWIDVIKVNKNTGRLVDGHLRVKSAIENGQATVPVIFLDLTEAEERQALLSLDPIAAMAETDAQKMEELRQAVSQTATHQLVNNFLNALKPAETLNSVYSREIKAPEYVPSEDKPELSDLYDDTKTKELIQAIDASNIRPDEKAFLRMAAQRHTVLNFQRIADYFAHSPDEVKTLFEQSALVLIDFDKAIELGYLKLTEDIQAMFADDYGDEQ